MPDDRALAALFIDFENVYYFLKDAGTLPANEEATDLVVRMLESLRALLVEKYGEHTISFDAYADFERITEGAQGALYLLGVNTHNVLGTDHKNAADMRLCIDAMEVLHTRREITTFVIVAGDRDYIPVVQHLKKYARTVRVVGFPRSVSGDLLTALGKEYFIDATPLLPARAQAALSSPQTAETAAAPPSVDNGSPGHVKSDTARAVQQYRRTALHLMIEHFGDKPEIWLSPFLHKMRAMLPELTESDRRAILADLRDSGAIRVRSERGSRTTTP